MMSLVRLASSNAAFVISLLLHQIDSSGLAAEHVPAVIAGAGPTGLTLALLLSRLGIPSLLLDRASGLTSHPQVQLYSS